MLRSAGGVVLLLAGAAAGARWTPGQALARDGPEPMARRFVRGDADLSGSVTLSDAIAVLRYLFAGGRGVPCLKAADTDDNGRVDLSDAVVTLCFLFAHGPSPEPPYPWCGIDESVDRLGCRNSSCGSLE